MQEIKLSQINVSLNQVHIILLIECDGLNKTIQVTVCVQL